MWPSTLNSLLVPKTEALDDGFTRPTVLEPCGSKSTCSFQDREPVLGIWKVFVFGEGSLDPSHFIPGPKGRNVFCRITYDSFSTTSRFWNKNL